MHSMFDFSYCRLGVSVPASFTRMVLNIGKLSRWSQLIQQHIVLRIKVANPPLTLSPNATAQTASNDEARSENNVDFCIVASAYLN
jgi:hypothetical protein